MAELVVIADDLTGANDTAVQFSKRGLSTWVQISADQENIDQKSADVLVINTDSRDLKVKEAYGKIKQLAVRLKTARTGYIYKKIDSTLRGSFGAEIAAVADVFEPEIVVIAPAYPETKRMTIGGYHFLDGLPIEMTEIARSPKTPVHESFIPGLIEEQTGRQAAVISLTLLKRGPEIVRQKIAEYLAAGQNWIVFDVTEEDHFETIRQSVSQYKNILWAGSAGLANHLPLAGAWGNQELTRKKCLTGPVLVVAGSVSHKTQQQTAEAVKEQGVPLVQVDPVRLVEEQKLEIQRCVSAIQQAVEAGKDVLLVSSLNDADVERAVRAGRNHGMSSCEVSEYTARSMGSIAKGLNMGKLSGLVLTGGDTAVHVLNALQARSIEILSEVGIGIPLGELRGGCCNGMRVITKAGAFGEKNCFVQAIHAIHGEVKEVV